MGTGQKNGITALLGVKDLRLIRAETALRD